MAAGVPGTALACFLDAYWNQMAPAIHGSSIDRAIADFMVFERRSAVELLCDDLVDLVDRELCAESWKQVDQAPRLREFWVPYSRLISKQNCLAAIEGLRGPAN